MTFDHNRYSVPVNLVGLTLTVKGYPLRVEVYQKNNLVAVHQRLYGQGRYQFELAYYLPLLERRPRSLLNARPLKETLAPALWAYYRQISGPAPER